MAKWAYREAELNIPRLAQEQDLGAAPCPRVRCCPESWRCWDGHVAMIVGRRHHDRG